MVKTGRPTTHGEPYHGIKKERNGTTWSARVNNKGIGSFDDAEAAAHGFDCVLRVHKGEEARALPEKQGYNRLTRQYMTPELEAKLDVFREKWAGDAVAAWVAAHKKVRAEQRDKHYRSCGGSRFRGVQWDRTNCVWFVQEYRGDNKVHYRGSDEVAAAREADKAAIRRWGRKAFTNFPLTNSYTEAELDAYDQHFADTASASKKGRAAGPLIAASEEQRAQVEAYLAACQVDPFVAERAAAERAGGDGAAGAAAGEPAAGQGPGQPAAGDGGEGSSAAAAPQQPAEAAAAAAAAAEPGPAPESWEQMGLSETCIDTLREAASTGCKSAVEHALDLLPPDDSRRRDYLQHALCTAASDGHAEAVQALMEAGAAASVALLSDGNTALHLAAERGHMGACDVMLRGKGNVLAENQRGRSPLQLAADKGHLATVLVLTAGHINQGGGLVHPRGMDNQPLLTPYQVEAHASALELALARDSPGSASAPTAGAASGAPTPAYPPPFPYTRIQPDFTQAARLVQLLAMSGVNSNQRMYGSSKGDCLLHAAARAGAMDGIQGLIAGGASINQQNFAGETPLLCAVRSENGPAVDLLLGLGADPQVADAAGVHPLEAAIVKQNDGMRRLLRATCEALDKGKRPAGQLRREGGPAAAASGRRRTKRARVAGSDDGAEGALPGAGSGSGETGEEAEEDQDEPMLVSDDELEGDMDVDNEATADFRKVPRDLCEMAGVTWADAMRALKEFQDARLLEGPRSADDPGQRLVADTEHIGLLPAAACAPRVVGRLVAAAEAALPDHRVVNMRICFNGGQAPGAAAGTQMYQRNHTDALGRMGGMHRGIAWLTPEGYKGAIGVLAPSTGHNQELRARDGERGRGFWMFSKEFLHRTAHRNLTTPGQQSVSIVFDTVPVVREAEAERAGYKLGHLRRSRALAAEALPPAGELPAGFQLSASCAQAVWEPPHGRLQPVLSPREACAVFGAATKEEALGIMRILKWPSALIPRATEIFGFEVSSGGTVLRCLLLCACGYDRRSAYSLACEITPTRQEADARRYLVPALSTEEVLAELKARNVKAGISALRGLHSQDLLALARKVFPGCIRTSTGDKVFLRLKLLEALGVPRHEAEVLAVEIKFEPLHFRAAVAWPGETCQLLRVSSAEEAVDVVCTMEPAELGRVYEQVFEVTPLQNLAHMCKAMLQAAGMKRTEATKAVQRHATMAGSVYQLRPKGSGRPIPPGEKFPPREGAA